MAGELHHRISESLPRKASTPSSEARLALRMLRQRRERDRLLGRELFGEPIWTMLLMLFVAREKGTGVPLSSLCAEAGVPVGTARRWARTLAAEGKIKLEDEQAHLDPCLAEQLRALLGAWLAGAEVAEKDES